MAQLTTKNESPLSVSRNLSWNFAGKVVYAAARAFLLILIAKLSTVEIVGQYSLAFSITTPIFMLTDFDLRSIIATDTKDQYEFGHYLGMRLLTTLLAMLVVCGISCWQSTLQLGLVIFMVGLSKSFETISDLLYGLMQRQERLDKLGISQILKSTLSIVFVGLLLWQTQSIVLATAGMAAAYLLILLVYDLPVSAVYASLRVRLDRAILWKLFRLSLPMGIALLFISLNKNVSSYFVEVYLDTDSLGYFSSILYIMTVGSLVVSSIGQTTTSRMSRLFNRGDIAGFRKILRNMVLAVLGIGAVMTAGAALFGDFVLTLLYKPGYAVYQPLFVMIMGIAGLSYAGEISRFAITATHQFKLQPYAYGGVLLFGVVCYMIFVPWLQLYGAALSLLITAVLQLCINMLILQKALARQKRAPARTA